MQGDSFAGFIFSFCLDTKRNKKIKAGTMTTRSCHTTMFSFYTTVASAFVILLLSGSDPTFI
jgi:hypothetical protein